MHKHSNCCYLSDRILRKTSFAQAYEESVAASLSMPDNIQSAEADVENNQRSNNMADWDSEPVCNSRVKIWSALAGVVVVVGIFISVIVSSIHRVREGNVGIYFKHGALMDDVSYPGMHMMAPFVTEANK